MRTVDYIDVLRVSAKLCGLDPDNLDAADFSTLRDFHSNRLNEASEFQRWPELERTEKRYFRALYNSATAYTAPSATVAQEVFWAQTKKYYQTLVATTGNDPTDSAGTTDLAHWAECATDYTADAYAAATAYVRGNIAYYPPTDRFYQLYAASSTGNLPTDATKWGILTEFDRVVYYAQTGQTALGQVLDVWDGNPVPNFRAAEVNWSLSSDGVQVEQEVPYVWVVYRRRAPVLNGDAYDAAATYTVSTQIYYASATLKGNFYTRATATSTAGQSPDTDAANWTLVEIPLLFDRFLKHAGAGDWLASEQRLDEAQGQFGLAEAALDAQGLLLTGQQGQNQRTAVLTR